MANVTNILTLTVTSNDQFNSQVISRAFGPLTFIGNTGVLEVALSLLTTGDNIITLPAAIIYNLIVKNTDPANSITVKWTPNAGAAATIVALGPGATIALFNIALTNGLTSLTINGTVGTKVDLFLGA